MSEFTHAEIYAKMPGIQEAISLLSKISIDFNIARQNELVLQEIPPAPFSSPEDPVPGGEFLIPNSARWNRAKFPLGKGDKGGFVFRSNKFMILFCTSLRRFVMLKFRLILITRNEKSCRIHRKFIY